MNYKTTLYKNALRTIEEIYLRSQYNPDIDLYRSLDIMHSVNENQLSGKEWLVEQLIQYLPDKVFNIAVLGSWYGSISVMLREKLNEDIHIQNIDSDPFAAEFGKSLCKDLAGKRTYFKTYDAAEYVLDEESPSTFDIIINTSCEHMEQEDIDLIMNMKRPQTLICFQSNNYDSVQSHINTKQSLNEFVESLNLSHVLFTDEKEFPEYNRYMVIGK